MDFSSTKNDLVGSTTHSRGNTKEPAAVCDASTGTTEDAVASRVLPYLPYYLASLAHFNVILGTAVIRWLSDRRRQQNGISSRSFKDLLGVLQSLYSEEEELTTVQSGVSTVICEKFTNEILECQCIDDRSKNCQTDEDISWTKHVKRTVEDSERFIRSLGSDAEDSQSRSASPSSDSEGPEEHTEEDRNLGATAVPSNHPGNTSRSSSQNQATSEQRTAVPRDPNPETRVSPDSDTEDDAVGTQGAAAEELRHLVDEDKCKVCLENEMDIVLLPCGHFVMCSDCSARVSRCPTCREVIQATLRAYRP